MVYEEADIPEALRRMRDCEVLLIDTPGLSPREQGDEAEMRGCLRAHGPDEIHLTLPAGLKPRQVDHVTARARRFGVTHILPTKVDESPDDQTVFMFAAEAQLPIRWIADGQRVPQDLQPVSVAADLTAGDEHSPGSLLAAA